MTSVNAISRKVAIRKDGLHGLIYRDMMGDTYLMTWTNISDIKEVKIPWPDGVSDPDFGFLDLNRIALTGMNGFVQPPHALEVEISNQTTALDWAYGTAQSKAGEGCQLSNGGFVRINYVDTSPENLIRLEVAYRRPFPFLIPGDTAPNWWTGRWDFPSNTGSAMPFFFTVIEGPDKLIWAFFSRDSAGQIGIARFEVVGNALQLVDEKAGWMDRNQGAASPMGEFPRLTSTLDRTRNRIILMYESWDYQITTCAVDGVSQFVILGVKPDLSYSTIATIPFWSYHNTFQIAVAWSRTDGVYFLSHYVDLKTCIKGWKSGIINGTGQVRYNPDIIGGNLKSYSDDGWFVFEHVDRSCSLEKMPFAPTLKISRTGINFVISWDKFGPTDQLQQSSDFKTWVDIPGATSSPVAIINDGKNKFFRLKL